MRKALAALQRMEASEREINFRTVAAEAQVSTAWLYNQVELRNRIMHLRKSQSHATSDRSPMQAREHLSRQNIVATLQLRIKKLEDKNRRSVNCWSTLTV